MSKRWCYVLTPQAMRDLRRLDKPVHQRILEALDRLLLGALSGDVRKLRGRETEYRLRVGDWRVRFRPSPDEQVAVVLRVAHRATAGDEWGRRI